ncbi:hypothetical protein PGB90_010538 [Kerria lacca]
MAVVIETTLGDITIDLYSDARPTTCNNFLKLCKMKYYNFNLFYSIQNNFIAQTGDPTGSGNGGESVFSFAKKSNVKYITGEKQPRLKHNRPGLVSMVNCGDHLIGSQFFITLGHDLYSLDEHIMFGEVTEGHEVLRKLNETICDLQYRPYQDVRITHTVILEDPFDEIAGLNYPSVSPEPTREILQSNRIGADEEINDRSKCSAAQIQEIEANQEAKAQATILEIVGDIPSADIAPPENVLFVCKLNPVTTDEDLEIIFSRFGKINSCEVIRDKLTGDSLQYAFIEFDNKKSCEDAYLKMDNVLIDDRRIHVDFSQSVAKMRWRGKGRGVEYFNKEQKLKEESMQNEKKIHLYHEHLKKKEKKNIRHSGESDKHENYSEEKSKYFLDKKRHHLRSKRKNRSRSRSRHHKRSRSKSKHRSKNKSRNYSRDRRNRSRSRNNYFEKKQRK